MEFLVSVLTDLSFLAQVITLQYYQVSWLDMSLVLYCFALNEA